MSDVNNNDMGAPYDITEENAGEKDVKDVKDVFHKVKGAVIDKLNELNHEDHVHGLHETDDLDPEKVNRYVLVQAAIENVSYGTNYFGKIRLYKDVYIHVRAHKSEKGAIDFYSIKEDGGSVIRDPEEPLTYFNI